jgi:hypothetical protein
LAQQLSYKLICVKEPTEKVVTITVFSSSATNCDSSQTVDVSIPTYEGCNEDFPFVLDLTCVGGWVGGRP